MHREYSGLYLAALDTEDGVRIFALREDNLSLPIFGYGSPTLDFGEKRLRIERPLCGISTE